MKETINKIKKHLTDWEKIFTKNLPLHLQVHLLPSWWSHGESFASTTCGKMWLVFLSNPALQPILWTHAYCMGMLPHRQSLKTSIGNFSPNFLETEKVMQNDKTVEFVSTERIRKKKKNLKNTISETETSYQLKSLKH